MNRRHVAPSLGSRTPRPAMMSSNNTPAINVRPSISVIGGIVATPSLTKGYEPPHSVASSRSSANSLPIEGSRAFVPVIVIASRVMPEREALHGRSNPMLRRGSNDGIGAPASNLEHSAVVTGLTRNPKLAATVQLRHHRHDGHDRPCSGVNERRLDIALFAKPDQIARGRERQLEPSALPAGQGFPGRQPDRVGRFL